MGDDSLVVDAPVRQPVTAPDIDAAPAQTEAATFAGTLLGIQRRAGNRAAVQAAQHMAQRDPDPSDTASGSGTDDMPLEPYEGGAHVPSELLNLDMVVFGPLRNFTWDATGQRNKLPLDLFKPQFGLVITANKLIVVDRFGNPHEMRDVTDDTPKQARRGAFIVQLTTGDAWQLFTRGGIVDKADYFGEVGAYDVEKLDPGNSILYDLMPDVTMDAAQIRQVESMIRSTQAAVRRAAGPPGWASSQHEGVVQRRRGAATGAGTTGTGTGSGRTGEGAGGGGDAETALGTGPETVPGDGTEAPTETPSPPGDGRPLQGPVDITLEMSPDGYPRLRVKIDRASTTVPLRQREEASQLDARIDAAIEALQQSRDPDAVTGVRDGATTTGFAGGRRGEVGEARSGEATRAQAEGARGMATPGERSAAGGIANTEQYPSAITMAGYTPPPKEPPAKPGEPPPPEGRIASDVNAPTTTIGATNSFTMTLDYAAMSFGLADEVFNRLQHIHYYWELIDVTGLTPTAAGERDMATGLGEGEEQDLSGDAADLRRTMDNIAEDQANDIRMMQEEDWPWEARAAYLGVIGLSNTVRAIGSLIASFVSILTRPLNEQSIGFDREGEFLVRCVATPVPSDEAKADPDRHVIRASSVAVMPIRVQNLSKRATETLEQEDRQLAALEAALAAARTDEERRLAQAKLDAYRRGQQLGGLDTLRAATRGIREQLATAEKLRSHRALHVPESAWELPEINLEIALLTSRVKLEDHIARLQAQLKLMAGGGATSAAGNEGSHERWAREQAAELRAEVRPRVVLASEENGQVTPVLLMLGQLDDSTDERKRWRLIDITSPGSRDYYTGESRVAGEAGHGQAIRDAFRNFAENNPYGRGTIAIRLPPELAAYASALPDRMRSTPGATARMMQRLKDLATVAEVVGLFVTGPAAWALGAVGGAAGAVVAVDALAKRARTDHLLEVGTIFDILGVVGGVASVGGMGAGIARLHVDEIAAAGGRMPTWVNRLERTERALHIHGTIGNLQQVIAIPWQLIEQWEQIQQQVAAGAISEGQARARGALALLQGLRSGAVTIISASGGLARPDRTEPATRPGEWDLPAGFRGDAAAAHADGTGPAVRPVTDGEPGVRPVGEEGGVPTDRGEAPPVRVPSDAELVAEALRRAEQTRRASDAAVDADLAAAGQVPTRRSTPAGGEPTRGVGEEPPRADAVRDGLATLATRMGAEPDPASQQPRRGTVTPDPDAAAVIRDAGDLGVLRRQVATMPSLTAPQRAAVQARLQEARVAATTEHIARVLDAIQPRFPDVQLSVQDLGTVGFASDRDITVRATPRDPAAYAAMDEGQRAALDRQLVQASAETIPLLYASLDGAGLPAQRALDTNFYTELHESRIRPADQAEAVQIAADQEIVSLSEVLLNVSHEQWRAYVESQLRMIDDIEALTDPERSDMRNRFESQVLAAELNARRLLGGDLPGQREHGEGEIRDAALQRARERLTAALQRDPPPSGRETRQLMADIKLLEPDAYGTRAAVEGVVLGSQGMRSATMAKVREDGFRTRRQIERNEGEPGPLRLDPDTGQMVELSAEQELQRRQREALPNVGRIRPGSSYELNARSLSQAEAVLAHLLGHVPAPGEASYGSASTAAKNLGRIASIAEDAAIPDSRGGGLGHLPDIVAAKQAPEPAAPTRDAIRAWAAEGDVAAWAGREGVPIRTDSEQLAAFIQWSQSEALRLVGAMRTRAGVAAIHEGVAAGTGGNAGLPRPAPPVDDETRPAADGDEGGVRRTDRPDDDVVDLDDPANRHLTDQMVGVLPEALQRDRQASEAFFEGFVRSHPDLESSLLHNPVTGRFLVIQGNAERSSYTELEARLAELIPPAEAGRGRWVVEAHNHPIDGRTKTTPMAARAPSLDDVAGTWREAIARGGRASERIRIETERGPEEVRITIDPTAQQPILIDLPRPDGGREQQPFARIEDYAEWYRVRFGRDAGAIPADVARAGGRVPADRSAPSTDIVDTGGQTALRSSREEYVRQEFFAEDRTKGAPFNSRYHAHSRLSDDGTMTMDFHLREERGGEMHRSSMSGREQFREALHHFRGTIGPDAVRRVRGEWGHGDNLTSFQARYQQLVEGKVPDAQARLIAAAETRTGEWATGEGFGRMVDVRIDEDGVTATFEPGPSNKPPVPPELESPSNVPAARRTPSPGDGGEQGQRGQEGPAEAAHQQFLEQLRIGLATPLDAPVATGRPLGEGEVGRFDSPASAYQAFRDAVGRAGGREVGLFYDPAARTYAVMVGNDTRVNPPDTGGPWDCPIHTHPNEQHVLTYRMPAPQDVFGTWQEAMRSDRPAVGFVESPLPDGRRVMSRVQVDPDGRITFDWPDADGVVRTESLTIQEYQRRWDDRTRYVEPGSDQYQQFLRDMDDHRRTNPARGGSGGLTATGTAPVSRLPHVRRRLQSWREEAEADPSTPEGALHVIDELIAEADRIDLGLRDGSVDPLAVTELQADITRYRRQLRRGSPPAERSDEPAYEVRLELADPVVRADVLRWFEAESTELLGMPLGEHLRDRMLDRLAGLDEIVLQQSPRGGGGVAGTAGMRREVQQWIDAGRYPPDVVAAFLAARGPDGWPLSADGRAWEVDHVLELWAGGEDGPANYLPLHPDLHRIKSEIWSRFRRRFRDQLAEIDEQVDTREHGPLGSIPEPVGR